MGGKHWGQRSCFTESWHPLLLAPPFLKLPFPAWSPAPAKGIVEPRDPGMGGSGGPQSLLWAGCHPLDQAARSRIQPGLEHLQGWGSCSFSGQPAPVLTSPRPLGWVPRGCWAGRMSGKQAGWMAPCHALRPLFPSRLAFSPSLWCSFFSSLIRF